MNILRNDSYIRVEYKVFDTFFLPYKKKCLVKGTGTVIISTVK